MANFRWREVEKALFASAVSAIALYVLVSTAAGFWRLYVPAEAPVMPEPPSAVQPDREVPTDRSPAPAPAETHEIHVTAIDYSAAPA